MTPDKRLPLGLKAKVPDVKKLRELSGQMTTLAKGSFQFHYGLLLDLLQVKVNENALVTFAQFYDPPLRCFTFQDFQIAPTLEEFAKILGYSLEKAKPYLGIEEEPTMEALAKALHLDINEVTSWLVNKKTNGKVIPREVLEAKTSDLLIKKEWGSFNAVLALLVYGLVLFPKLDGFIDMAAMGVFLVGNPVHPLLADFHLSLYSRHEKGRGGTITCCTPLMQLWLVSHLPKKGAFVENQYKFNWPDRMVVLTEKDISWYSREYDGTEVILRCGGFLNVPLMGPRGCINYNPVLSLRQLGYPMNDKLEDRHVEEFILKEGENDSVLVKKIQKAWGQVHKKKMEKKNCVAKPPYTQ